MVPGRSAAGAAAPFSASERKEGLRQGHGQLRAPWAPGRISSLQNIGLATAKHHATEGRRVQLLSEPTRNQLQIAAFKPRKLGLATVKHHATEGRRAPGRP